MNLMKSTLVAAGAATTAFLWDPVSGKRRRARLRDQSAAMVRKGYRRARGWLRYQRGVAKGVVHEATEPLRSSGSSG
jgi:hypothetical protein